MRSLIRLFLCPIVFLSASYVSAADFSGRWVIDLRTELAKKENAECGMAIFDLKQAGENVVGSHEFATTGCGRLNEGGEDTVKGIAVGNTAVLVVTSGRNGAIFLGKAALQNGSMNWRVTHEITSGDSEVESPLVLHEGVLKLEASNK